ncbi:deubiquitinase OTUD6B [Anastrepha ludens]|uniref:deubiquitinase OTUD6B n=1 Tax=Anastrepha ludens TaxID=28586 RepID=UPI0023B1EB3A|nr:deubiquitinase OTUD6B [Anastrepha ludens]
MSHLTTESELSEALSGISLEDVLTRHRRERKNLQAKIQALKKNAPKNDKKKRKETMEEVARLESDLEKRQAAELAELEETQQKEEPSSQRTSDEQQDDLKQELCNDEGEENTCTTQRVSKAQKRREKKEREARQREEDIRAAAEDAKFAPKAVEARTIQAKLLDRKLAPHSIPSDGDCLYNAVRHQLSQNGLAAHSVQELRNETANYIRAHKDALICYMTNTKTGNLLTDSEFEQYCETLRTTPAWGGQIELKALSSVLKVPIEVLQAEGPPTTQGADEFAGPNLLITYHRHMYSLGEHYNSTVPIDQADTGNTNESG